MEGLVLTRAGCKPNLHIAQGNTLGKRVYNTDALKEQKHNTRNLPALQCFCPCKATAIFDLYPGCYPGLRAWGTFSPPRYRLLLLY